MNNFKSNKYIAVHAGKRDDYQIALALQEANMLFALVTELYFPLNKKWFVIIANLLKLHFSFHKRYKEGLPSEKVIISYEAFLYQLLFMITKNEEYDLKKGAALGQKAKKISQKYNIPIIAVNTCAADAFEQNSVTPKILFQFHPQSDFIKEIYLEEINLNPKSKETLMTEYEFKMDEKSLLNYNKEIELADHYICASSVTKKSLIYKNLEDKKIKVIPYGVDIDKFKFKQREQSDVFKVIFIGTINYRKGIKYLLDSLSLMNNVELTIVTRGNFYKNIIDNYSFPINLVIDVPHDKLQEELHKAHCFVLPSILEGFGQVILEAMATGIPVIATENTAANDIVENGVDGFVTPIRDVQAIKVSLEKLQSDFSFTQAMGKAAHEKAKIYSWQKFRTDLVMHIQSLS